MGKKKRPQGKPQEMSLAEFNQKTPVDMSIPRIANIDDPKWSSVDLSKSKDPQQQAKLFVKKIVEPTSAAAASSAEQKDQNSAQAATAATN